MARLNFRKAIWVVEGPAGAGKTHLINKMVSLGVVSVDNAIPELCKLPRPRNYGDTDGNLLAIMRDTMRLGLALTMPDDAVIDRYLISSYVYQSLRGGNFDISRLEHILSGADDIRRGTARRLYAQGVIPNPNPQYRVGWLLYLPPLKVIEARRRMGEAEGRTYPFLPEDEARLYRKVKRAWRTTSFLYHGPLIHIEAEEDVDADLLRSLA